MGMRFCNSDFPSLLNKAGDSRTAPLLLNFRLCPDRRNADIGLAGVEKQFRHAVRLVKRVGRRARFFRPLDRFGFAVRDINAVARADKIDMNTAFFIVLDRALRCIEQNDIFKRQLHIVVGVNMRRFELPL